MAGSWDLPSRRFYKLHGRQLLQAARAAVTDFLSGQYEISSYIQLHPDILRAAVGILQVGDFTSCTGGSYKFPVWPMRIFRLDPGFLRWLQMAILKILDFRLMGNFAGRRRKIAGANTRKYFETAASSLGQISCSTVQIHVKDFKTAEKIEKAKFQNKKDVGDDNHCDLPYSMHAFYGS